MAQPNPRADAGGLAFDLGFPTAVRIQSHRHRRGQRLDPIHKTVEYFKLAVPVFRLAGGAAPFQGHLGLFPGRVAEGLQRFDLGRSLIKEQAQLKGRAIIGGKIFQVGKFLGVDRLERVGPRLAVRLQNGVRLAPAPLIPIADVQPARLAGAGQAIARDAAVGPLRLPPLQAHAGRVRRCSGKHDYHALHVARVFPKEARVFAVFPRGAFAPGRDVHRSVGSQFCLALPGLGCWACKNKRCHRQEGQDSGPDRNKSVSLGSDP